ncbi:N-acyl-D-amino-acid deacylase [Nitrosomonas oligotropha]|uniref:N-acyl-D-amino-acid deacylase n=2 Tax=Nitrosomonas oligotropha TaxID=42354 RepID=A0A1H8V125_9PROT|nr:N-acyl-D-amino-acid deacylase [Nitrosomonas oligotropha]SEP08933.1 N-acyl-D-amino-acid deacylase [Nitrosomonas oligotropha]
MTHKPPTYIVNLILMATCSCPVFSATGIAHSDMESFDTVIPALMSRWNIPGAAVAVMKEGRLIFARGYGYADKSKNELVMPDSLFRIASISKPITATCVMRLVEQGRISLDTKVFPFLDLGVPSDTRINQITVRNLLEHTGWLGS